MAHSLLGKTVKITSDNDCYEAFFNKKLVITHVATNRHEHPGYDESVGGVLVDLRTEEGEEVPFSLYRWEFRLVQGV